MEGVLQSILLGANDFLIRLSQTLTAFSLSDAHLPSQKLRIYTQITNYMQSHHA